MFITLSCTLIRRFKYLHFYLVFLCIGSDSLYCESVAPWCLVKPWVEKPSRFLLLSPFLGEGVSFVLNHRWGVVCCRKGQTFPVDLLTESVSELPCRVESIANDISTSLATQSSCYLRWLRMDGVRAPSVIKIDSHSSGI